MLTLRKGLTLLELVVVLTILVALATLVVPMISPLGRGSQAVSTWENLLRLQDLLVNRYMVDMHDASGNPSLPRPGYAGLNASGGSTTRPDHPQLRYLFINPGPLDTTSDSAAETPFASANTTFLSPRHWQGPYLTHQGARYAVMDPTAIQSTATHDQYGVGDVLNGTTNTATTYGDPTVLDAWGHPIVIQVPTVWDNSMPTGADPTKYARLVSAGPDGALTTTETVGMPTPAQRGDDLVMFLFVPDQYGTNAPKVAQ